MVYDVTNRASFDNVTRWLSEIDKYAREGVNKLLVGNKCDQDESGARQVSKADGMAFAETKSIPFLETSAKMGTFVDTAFLMMAHDIKTKMTSVPERQTGFGGMGGGGGGSGCWYAAGGMSGRQGARRPRRQEEGHGGVVGAPALPLPPRLGCEPSAGRAFGAGPDERARGASPLAAADPLYPRVAGRRIALCMPPNHAGLREMLLLHNLLRCCAPCVCVSSSSSSSLSCVRLLSVLGGGRREGEARRESDRRWQRDRRVRGGGGATATFRGGSVCDSLAARAGTARDVTTQRAAPRGPERAARATRAGRGGTCDVREPARAVVRQSICSTCLAGKGDVVCVARLAAAGAAPMRTAAARRSSTSCRSVWG